MSAKEKAAKEKAAAPTFTLGSRVKTPYSVDPELDPKKWPLEAGQIVEEFVVGDDVEDSEYGRDWAVMRRWGIALDTGTLVFRNDENLEPE